MASQLLTRLQGLTDVSGTALHLCGLHKAFGPRVVLRDLDLALERGEFVAVLGPSGGGKSTLLKILAGLEPPTAGQVHLQEVSRVRIMFQEDRLLPWLSTLDNITLGLGREAHDGARELLVGVGLDGRERDWPTVLSGGQRQRAALARALAHRPNLLLLDEPFGALDALTRTTMQDLLLDLWQRERNTVLLVTHDVEEALVLADRVLLLIDGRLDDDFRVDLPRPRRRGDPRLATLKEELLERLISCSDRLPR
jgi:sulfonate transport system ATP-binding protein